MGVRRSQRSAKIRDVSDGLVFRLDLEALMDARDAAEAVEVLDLLLAFFGDGERWVKGRLSDRRGNRCLVGALGLVSGRHATDGAAAERCLAEAIRANRFRGAQCDDNDEAFARLRAALRRGMRGEGYCASESLLRRDKLSDFNDGCKDFTELRALILRAREMAMKDVDPPTRPRFEIEVDELVLA